MVGASNFSYDQDGRQMGIAMPACVITVELVQFLIEQNTSVEEIVHGVTELCIDLKIEDNLVCTQIYCV